MRARRAGGPSAASSIPEHPPRVRRSLRLARQSRAGIQNSEEASGSLSELPMEIVEQVLLNCSAPQLGVLASTAHFFASTGLVERVAKKLVLRHPRGRGLTVAPRESWAQLLNYLELCGNARGAGRTIALGSFHSALVCRDGPTEARALFTAGRGFHGQLGQEDYKNEATHCEVTLPPPDEDFPGAGPAVTCEDEVVQVACGSSHTAAVTRSGALYTWGLASSGELGHGGWTPIELNVPRLVQALMDTTIVAVSCGANHTLAVGKCGGLWSCGRGRHGQLGHGHFHDEGPLARVEALKEERVQVASAGATHSMVLCGGGRVFSWGDNRHGQLGHGPQELVANDLTTNAWPRKVEALEARFPGAPEEVAGIACGAKHSAAVTTAGKLYTWGRGRTGALGLGSREDKGLPSKVPLMGERPLRPRTLAGLGVRCIKVACGAGHTVALVHNPANAYPEVCTTGTNAYGQLGHGGQAPAERANLLHLKPVKRLQGLQKTIVDVAAGDDNSAAVTADGRVFVWGRGEWGQLGTGDERSHLAPREI